MVNASSQQSEAVESMEVEQSSAPVKRGRGRAPAKKGMFDYSNYNKYSKSIIRY